jgi:hypothetical protein
MNKEQWQLIIEQLNADTLPIRETVDLLYHPAPNVRVLAMWSLRRRAEDVPDIATRLTEIALDPANQTAKLIGVATVSQEAVYALFEIRTDESFSALLNVWKQLPEIERYYLQTRFEQLDEWIDKNMS